MEDAMHMYTEGMKRALVCCALFLGSACGNSKTRVAPASTSGLASLLVKGHQLCPSLQTRQLDDSVRHLPSGMVPEGNPHHSTDPAFVEAIARSGSQGRLSGDGIRSALYAVYVAEKDLGFYGLEAESEEGANQRETALRDLWSVNVGLDRARVHREGLVIVVVWTDGVSPQCWEAVNRSVAERLVTT